MERIGEWVQQLFHKICDYRNYQKKSLTSLIVINFMLFTYKVIVHVKGKWWRQHSKGRNKREWRQATEAIHKTAPTHCKTASILAVLPSFKEQTAQVYGLRDSTQQTLVQKSGVLKMSAAVETSHDLSWQLHFPCWIRSGEANMSKVL